jgi:hypothetical protein
MYFSRLTFHCSLCLLTLAVVGCSALRSGPKQMDPQEYVSWYTSEKYPFRDTVTHKDIVYTLERIPEELWLARNLQSRKITAEDAQEAYGSDPDALVSYQLTVHLPTPGKDVLSYNKRSSETSNERMSYFAFGMKNDLFLLDASGDTIQCSGFLYERGISNHPRATFMLDFNEPKDLRKLCLRDRYLSEELVVFDIAGFSAKAPKLTIK